MSGQIRRKAREQVWKLSKIAARPRKSAEDNAGERGLLIAVLDRAFRDLGIIVSSSVGTLDPREYETAFEYVFSNAISPFSFIWVLENLGMESEIENLRDIVLESRQ